MPMGPVIFLPGILMPAALRYAALIDALGRGRTVLAKDLEVYAGPAVPPASYSIDAEIAGIDRAADAAGFDRFHLYGHSGGGACAIAYTATHPDRVLSLALDEPASDFSAASLAELRDEFLPILDLPAPQMMSAFLSGQLQPGAVPPPPPDGPAPDWMATRPAGVKAFLQALAAAEIPIEHLEKFERPVYYSHGDGSNPSWTAMRDRLADLCPDFTAELYQGASHMRTSHMIDPPRVAAALHRIWSRAEARG